MKHSEVEESATRADDENPDAPPAPEPRVEEARERTEAASESPDESDPGAEAPATLQESDPEGEPAWEDESASSCEEAAAGEISASGESPPPAGELPSRALNLSVLAVSILFAAAVFAAAADVLSLGASAPFIAGGLVLVLAGSIRAILGGFCRRALAAREARAAWLFEALASDSSIELAPEDPLATQYERVSVAIRASVEEKIRAEESAWRRDAHHDLVRARSQCETLVERHVERMQGEREAARKALDAELRRHESEKREWKLAARESERRIAELSERLAAMEGTARESERKAVKLAKAAQLLETEVQARTQGCDRVADNVERLLEEISTLRKQRTRFFNTISTQIRGPLLMANQLAEDLLRSLGTGKLGAGDSESMREKATDIRNRSLQLQRLIEQIVDFCRLESDSQKLVYSEVDLHKLVEGVIGEVRSSAKQKGLEVHVQLPKGLPLLFTDGRLCAKVLRELLANAVQFTDRGGHVSLAARLSLLEGSGGGARLELEVKDSGRGISSEERERIFQPFERGPNLAFTPGGPDVSCGLGLALARGFVTLLRGEIELESEEKAGSTFRVRIPVKSTPERPAY